MTIFQLIKDIINDCDTNALVLDWRHYRLCLLPDIQFIKFPESYTYYKYPTLQIL